MIRSEDNGTILFEITPSYRNLNIRYVRNEFVKKENRRYLFRVLIGVESGYIDVICSIRHANFLVLNDQNIYYEYQSLTDTDPVLRDYDLTNEDLNFGTIFLLLEYSL